MTVGYRPPSPAELADLTENLRVLLWQTAWTLAGRDDGSRPHGSGVGALDVEEQKDAYLALLNAIAVTGTVLEDCEQDAARRAGRLGAGYPELAAVWGITRQGARRRWPDATPGPGDTPLRRALSAAVAGISTNEFLDSRTASRLLGPLTAAATAQAGASHAVVEAATRLLQAPPPAPADAATVNPLLDAVRQALEEYLSGDTPSAPRGPSSRRRFLAAEHDPGMAADHPAGACEVAAPE